MHDGFAPGEDVAQTEGEREEVGIYGGLIRMSRDRVEDIEADLGQALASL